MKKLILSICLLLLLSAGCNQSSSDKPVKNNSDSKTQIPLTAFSYKIDQPGNCEIPEHTTVVSILKDDKPLAGIDTQMCEFDKVIFRGVHGDSLYFSLIPSGLGGYILYDTYFNLYRFDLGNNKFDELFKIIDNGSLNHDSTKFIYSTTSGIVIRQLVDGGEQLVKFPDNIINASNAQIGDLSFSPDETKLAFAITSLDNSANDEVSGVYTVEIETGQADRFFDSRKTDIAYHVLGWNPDNTVKPGYSKK